MPTMQRRLDEWSEPLIRPGGNTVRLLGFGDSHMSQLNNGATEQRWEYGLHRKLPVTPVGFWSPAGSWLNQAIQSGTGGTAATINPGSTQHPTDGYVAPYGCTRYTWAGATASNGLIHRLPYAAATLATVRGGNPFASRAVTSRIGWWANATAMTTCRCRSYDSTFGLNTEDVTLDMTSAGTGAGLRDYRYRDFSHGASANAPLWDCLTGAEDETGKELTFLGSRFELTSHSGGVSFACVGNGGAPVADYIDDTYFDDQCLEDFLALWGPFKRIMVPMGTNMSAGESADIVGVWGPNLLTLCERLIAANDAVGGPADAMVLVVSGHDANITSRYADMAQAIDNVSAANVRIAHCDTWGRLLAQGITYATMNSTYLADGVHFNAAGADLLAETLGNMMTESMTIGTRGRAVALDSQRLAWRSR